MSNKNLNLLIKRLCNLLTIKSIISLSLLFVFCYLTFKQLEVPEQLASVFGYVVAFFLGTQTKDKSTEDDNKEDS
jgi:Na+/H+ antiporter NhaC